MALMKEQLEFLKAMHGKLKDEPLLPDDPMRVQLREELSDADPVQLMATEIYFSGDRSTQFFSGFSGSGKTTELFRLRRNLEADGALVLYADAMLYLNQAEPLVLSEMLMVLAGAFSDAIEDHPDLGDQVAAESYWDSVCNFVNETNVRLTGVDADVGWVSPGRAVAGGLKAGVRIKTEIKTATTFKQDLAKFLSGHISALKADVDKFITDAVEAIRHKIGADRNIVFIFDSLEKITGTPSGWNALIRSAELLFTAHRDQLELPGVHAIYSVPAWMKFLAPASMNMRILPTVHLWVYDPDRIDDQKSWDMLRTLIDKRLGPDGEARLFHSGETGQRMIRDLIRASGGHIRDLLRLFQETLLRATTLPIQETAVRGAINATKRNLLPLSLEDAVWLRDIARTRDISFAEVNDRTIERASRFLNTHRVIYFTNGSDWYDIHPLLRDEIARVIDASAPDKPA